MARCHLGRAVTTSDSEVGFDTCLHALHLGEVSQLMCDVNLHIAYMRSVSFSAAAISSFHFSLASLDISRFAGTLHLSRPYSSGVLDTAPLLISQYPELALVLTMSIIIQFRSISPNLDDRSWRGIVRFSSKTLAVFLSFYLRTCLSLFALFVFFDLSSRCAKESLHAGLSLLGTATISRLRNSRLRSEGSQFISLCGFESDMDLWPRPV